MTEAEILKFGSRESAEIQRRSAELLESLQTDAITYAERSISDATKGAYRSDWSMFDDWCSGLGLESMPAASSTVCLWITHLAKLGRAISTISRSVTTINQAHRNFNQGSPTTSRDVVATLKGVRREIGTSQKKAKALVLSDLKKVVDKLMPSFQGRRDRALLLVGWAAALRRSELVALRREDIEFCDEGMILTVAKSKTDQEHAGYRIGIPFARDERYCPVNALNTWIKLAKIHDGPLFFGVGHLGRMFYTEIVERKPLSDRMVSVIVQRSVRAAGFSPVGFSGHSLRAGFITSAAAAQIPEHVIQLHTRHRSISILRGYVREATLFVDNGLSLLL